VAPLDYLAGLRRGAAAAEPPGSVGRGAADVGGAASEPLRLVDLGAGGGLPSLAILDRLPDWNAVLLDAIQKRCSFLVWAVGELGVSDRVEVWCGRAEEIGHEERARFRFDAVVARGFGPPASTVECGAPLLRRGGLLMISEPPEGRHWPAEGLAKVGMTEVGSTGIESARDESSGAAGPGPWPSVMVLRRDGDVPPIHPRRAKAQQRTPLF